MGRGIRGKELTWVKGEQEVSRNRGKGKEGKRGRRKEGKRERQEEGKRIRG